MSRKSSRKIVYTLTPQSSLQGHSLGVNALAIDPNPPPADSKLCDDNENVSGLLYSAGRDGNIIAWQLCDMDLESTDYTQAQTLQQQQQQQQQSQSQSQAQTQTLLQSQQQQPDKITGKSPFGQSRHHHHHHSRSISSMLSPDPNESVSRLIGPSLAAFLNSTPQVDLPTIPPFPPKGQNGKTTFKYSGPIHTNWVNDILLVNDKKSIASCSSDLTVKLWNPYNDTQTTIGQHRDYVKCLASSASNTNPSHIYSAGLDRRIIGWDIERSSKSGTNEVFSINVGGPDNEKTSIYSLAASNNNSNNDSCSTIIAAGGPDATVRLWDSRTASANAKPIASFLGHTDNIRSLLISQHGDWVLSASADSSIKLWSVTAGRLLHTFDMHSDSVWSLSSQHPSLQVFYSSDRAGSIVKTDLRGVGSDIDKEGVCAVIANEHSGVSQVVSAGPYLWTATCNSRIHRWFDFDTTPYAFNKTFYESAEGSTASLDKKEEEEKSKSEKDTSNDGDEKEEPEVPCLNTHFLTIDGNACLRFNKNYTPKTTLPFEDTATIATLESASVVYSILPDDEEEATSDLEDVIIEPLYQNPLETLQGKIGLIKHQLLPNRRHVLTLDTAGEIKLWDLIRAVELKSFGTGMSMDDIAQNFQAYDVVSNWCQVTTRSGELFIALDQNSCFDAEVYADEILPEIGLDILQNASSENPVNMEELPVDQRINLGKWVLRNLFSNLIEQELEKDLQVRKDLVQKKQEGKLRVTSSATASGRLALQKSQSSMLAAQKNEANHNNNNGSSNGNSKQNAGLMGRLKSSFGKNKKDKKKDENGKNGKNANSSQQQQTEEVDPYANHDYDKEPFLPTWNEPELKKTDEVVLKDISDYLEKRYESRLCALGPYKEPEEERFEGEIENKVGNNPFLNNSQVQEQEQGETKIESNNPFSNSAGQILPEQDSSSSLNNYLPSILSPPTTLDAPILPIPGSTKLMISQLLPGSEGLMDLYRGSVSCPQSAADLQKMESLLPEWVSRAIFLNQIPVKEETKTWFILVACTADEQANKSVEPLPPLKSTHYLSVSQQGQNGTGNGAQAGDNNNNTNNNNNTSNTNGNAGANGPNANGTQQPPQIGSGRFTGYHMLRAHKAMTYLVEKLRSDTTLHIAELENPATREEAIAHPCRWLELVCQGQVVSKNMTLATVRTRIWRSGGDMMLKYRRKAVCELESVKAMANAAAPGVPVSNTAVSAAPVPVAATAGI